MVACGDSVVVFDAVDFDTVLCLRPIFSVRGPPGCAWRLQVRSQVPPDVRADMMIERGDRPTFEGSEAGMSSSLMPDVVTI